jgi:S-adenosylmethionine:tRNA ribosyltransferase-isomerase
MRASDFEFVLPQGLIAQTPLPGRDQSRLMVLNRASGNITHRHFRDLLAYLRAGDVLVLNNSRVIPARLRGSNAKSGGEFEILLLEEKNPNDWWCLLRPGKRGRIGTQIVIRDLEGNDANVRATVSEINDEGHRRLRFESNADIKNKLDDLGEVPLPPYIQRTANSDRGFDRDRYQTIFAQHRGSVAAPTAGLHFTESFVEQIRELGVKICFVTLHVGLGTFAPVKAEELSEHKMHEERFDVPEETARLLNEAKESGDRVIAVGTTTLRVLESGPRFTGLPSGPGRTNIFIHPPFTFKMVDALLTNFHLPRSTLLMLVSAFAAPKETRGRDLVLSAYAAAVAERYRFFSYGDAMLIL